MDAKTEEKTEATVSSIVKRDTSQMAAAVVPEWTRARIDLVKRTVCPKEITDDEFALFMEQCQRTGLDPLIREAYCVPRQGKRVFQAGHDGMLARADRFPDYGGIECAAVYSGDKITLSATEVSHEFNPAAPRGQLVGAWARVKRKGRVLPIEWVLLSEYAQPGQNPKWATGNGGQQQTMICKVARAAALRRAYPNVFGSSYIAEEWADERDVTPLPDAPTRTETLAERVKRQVAEAKPASAAPSVAAASPPVAPTSPPAASSTVDAPKASPPKAQPKPGQVRIGPAAGKAIADMDGPQLAAQLADHEARIGKLTPVQSPPWLGDARADVADMRAEMERRLAAASGPVDPPGLPPVERPREPGADDEIPFG